MTSSTISRQFSNQLGQQLSRVDGVDHINLNRFAATHLGKSLAYDWQQPFQIPHMGTFRSPRGFALWAISGDELFRNEDRERAREINARARNVRASSQEEFYFLILFAKFYQMAAMGLRILNEKALLELPWKSYIQRESGVREYLVWDDYCDIVKDYANYILENSTTAEQMKENGNRFEYNYAKHYPFDNTVSVGVLNTLYKYMSIQLGADVFRLPEELPPIPGRFFNPPVKRSVAQQHDDSDEAVGDGSGEALPDITEPDDGQVEGRGLTDCVTIVDPSGFQLTGSLHEIPTAADQRVEVRVEVTAANINVAAAE